MTGATYVWIGPANGKMSDAANWRDMATRTVATAPPAIDTTLVFRPGTYSVTSVTSESSTSIATGVQAGKLVLLPGAHLTLNTHSSFFPNPQPGIFTFQKVHEGPNSSLTVSGAALWSERTILDSGALLDGRASSLVTHVGGVYPLELGSLRNLGGTVMLRDSFQGANAMIGNVAGAPDPHHPGPGFAQIGGFVAGETVSPGPAALHVDLGDLHQGATFLPLQFAADDPNQSAGYSDLTINAHGDGFAPQLFQSIAGATTAFNQETGAAGYVPLGAVYLDTLSLGYHRELITLSSGSNAAERLIITDHIV